MFVILGKGGYGAILIHWSFTSSPSIFTQENWLPSNVDSNLNGVYDRIKYMWFLSIAISQLAGVIGSIFTAASVKSWYLTISKPSWNPPSWLFGPVWISLYTLMGIASYLVWQKRGANSNVKAALAIYGVHLVLNVLWSILFFGLKNPGLAFIEILGLLFFIVLTMVMFYKIRPVTLWLLLPYLLWVVFASFLNFTIWRLNR